MYKRKDHMPSETTVIVNLTPDLLRYVKARASGGGNAGVSEFVREALREKRLREQGEGVNLSQETAEEHRRLVEQGVAAFNQGDYTEFDAAGLQSFMADVSTRGKKRLARQRKKPAS